MIILNTSGRGSTIRLGGIMKHTITIILAILAVFSCISAEQIGVLEGHLIPDGLQVDKDHFYITEGSVISIHSMKDLSLLARFGKRGEGPGEFKGRIFPDVSGPEILVSSQGRVSFFSKQGKYLREVPVTSGRWFTPLDGFSIMAGYYSGMNKDGIRISGVYLFNKDFNRLKPVRTHKSIAQSEKGKGWHLFAKTYIYPYVCGSRIIVAADVDFRIGIFDREGNPVKQVQREYKRVVFTEQNRKKVLDFYRTHPSTAPEYHWWKKNIHFPEKFPAVRKIYTAEDRFYVRTYREKEGRHEFFVFTCDGDFINQVYLKINPSVAKNSYPYMRDSCPFAFRNGKIYQLVLDEEEDEFILTADDV